MITLEIFIIEAKEKLIEKFSILSYKQARGIECLTDRLHYQIANIYLRILSNETVFTGLTDTRKDTIVNCLKRILAINDSPNITTAYYGSQAIDEAELGIEL